MANGDSISDCHGTSQMAVGVVSDFMDRGQCFSREGFED